MASTSSFAPLHAPPWWQYLSLLYGTVPRSVVQSSVDILHTAIAQAVNLSIDGTEDATCPGDPNGAVQTMARASRSKKALRDERWVEVTRCGDSSPSAGDGLYRMQVRPGSGLFYFTGRSIAYNSIEEAADYCNLTGTVGLAQCLRARGYTSAQIRTGNERCARMQLIDIGASIGASGGSGSNGGGRRRNSVRGAACFEPVALRAGWDGKDKLGRIGVPHCMNGCVLPPAAMPGVADTRVRGAVFGGVVLSYREDEDTILGGSTSAAAVDGNGEHASTRVVGPNADTSERSEKGNVLCSPKDVCVGYGCRTAAASPFTRMADGTMFSPAGSVWHYDAERCSMCACRAPLVSDHHVDARSGDGTGRACVTLVPTRSALLTHAHDWRVAQLGYGSRLNSFLHVAAYALAHGHGFQTGVHACAVEDRRPYHHCAFEPVVPSCAQAAHMCTGPMRFAKCHGSFRYDGRRRFAARLAWSADAHPRRLDSLTLQHRQAVCNRILIRCDSVAEALARERAPSACNPLSAAERRACEETPLGMWRTVAQTVLRPQPEMLAAIRRLWLARFPKLREWAAAGRLTAMHVRRTDKRQEARAVTTCRYMETLVQHVEHHAASEGATHHASPHGFVGHRRLADSESSRDSSSSVSSADPTSTGGASDTMHVFVATDELAVLDELRACTPPHWRVHSFADAGPPGRGMNTSVVLRIWAEVILLASARVVVGTHSSNIGRLVQALRIHPPSSFVSLDKNWSAPEPFVNAEEHDSAGWQELGFAAAYEAAEKEEAKRVWRVGGAAGEPW